MLVAVDIGNTNIVLGFLDGDAIAGTYRITTKANHTSDEYGLFLTEFLRMSGFQPSDGRCDHLFGGAESDALLPFVHRQIPRH